MAASASPSTLKWLSNKLLLETMDWINVMTYDYTGDWTSYAGHHSPLFASSKQPGAPQSTELTMKYLVDRGMPANRLAVGLPLYGKGFAVSEPYAKTKKAAKGQAVKGGSYSNIEKLLKDKGWTRKWDDETKNPWAIAPDGSAVIAYDDAESIALKTDWAMKQKFRGVFFWEIKDDLLPDGTYRLQAAARKKWEESKPVQNPATQIRAVLTGAFHDNQDILRLMQKEKGLLWTAHPRIKASLCKREVEAGSVASAGQLQEYERDAPIFGAGCAVSAGFG